MDIEGVDTLDQIGGEVVMYCGIYRVPCDLAKNVLSVYPWCIEHGIIDLDN